jgi:hypothetical protein
MNPRFTLKGIDGINKYTPSMNLERNLVMYFDYGSIALGAFGNIPYNSSGVHGENLGKLNPVLSYQYGSGKVWEGYRNNWVWESGYAGRQPVNISGIYVNNVFSTTGYNVDYRNGQVILDSGRTANTNVRCSFSSKTIWWDQADSKCFKDLINESFRKDLFDATGIGSGIRTVLTNHRVQLPAVFIEVTSDVEFEGYQLGGGQYFRPLVNFYIFAENADQKKFLTDLITNQNEGSFRGVDFNGIRSSGDYIYNASGFLNSGAKTMPNLYNSYPWGVSTITFLGMRGVDIPYVPDLFRALIKCRCELVLGTI